MYFSDSINQRALYINEELYLEAMLRRHGISHHLSDEWLQVVKCQILMCLIVQWQC